MRVIARKTLLDFWANHSDAEEPLKAWFREAKKGAWKNPSEIKALYKNASILKNGRVVFNIAGNKYRLVVKIHYDAGVIYIRFIGTHNQYDKTDVETV